MERLGRITTSLPDLPIDRRMTYGGMRRAIIGLPVTVSSAILPDGLWGCYDDETHVILIDRRLTYTAKRCTLYTSCCIGSMATPVVRTIVRSRSDGRERRPPSRSSILPSLHCSNTCTTMTYGR